MIKMYRYTHIHTHTHIYIYNIYMYIHVHVCVGVRLCMHVMHACICTEFSSERADTKSFSSLELDISLECAAATLRRPEAPLFRE